jgi:hypothetical protein
VALTAGTAHRLVVHDPRGFPPKIEGKTLAPALPTLEGKTLYLVDGRFGNGADRFIEALEGWFAEYMPGVRARVIRWREPFADDPDASREIQQNADAAVFGVGI